MASGNLWRASSGGAPGGGAGGGASNPIPRDRHRSASLITSKPAHAGSTREAMMLRKIIGFHQDDAQDWVADLECRHKQHVRHTPPWLNRPWGVSAEGRRSRLGYTV